MTKLRDSTEKINVADYALSRIQDNLGAGVDAALGFLNTCFDYSSKTRVLTVTPAVTLQSASVNGNVSVGGGLTVAKGITLGSRTCLGVYQVSVPAGANTTYYSVSDMYMPYSGSVAAISVRGFATVTAGTMTAQVYNQQTTTSTPGAVVNTGSAFASITFAPGAQPFTAAQIINVAVVTSAGFAPAMTANISVWVYA